MRALAVAALLLLVSAASATGASDAPVVVVDAGHDLRANLATEPIGPGSAMRKILDGGGTRGRVSGVSEAVVNLAVAMRVRALLEQAGIRVVMTRTRTAGTSMGNIARARIANRARAALFLRIHADGSEDLSARGSHTLVPALRRGWTDDIHAESARAGRIVQRALVASLGLPDRGIQARSDFTGFNWANVPVILAETGFMTNPTERRKLRRAAYQWRVARGLANGTERFLGR